MERALYHIAFADNGGRPLSPDIGGHLLLGITPAVSSVSLMAIQGRGTARGRRPSWLRAVSDIHFRGAKVDGQATFSFDAPRLGDAAETLFRQPDFFIKEPLPQATGFDLLFGALRDIQEENEDSNRFDQSVLHKIHRLHKILSDDVKYIALSGESIEKPIHFDVETVQHVEKLTRTTPPEQRVRLAGQLDMLRSSTSTFELILDTGDKIRGVYDGDITTLSRHLRDRVTVSGKAIFRPSGKLLRVDAEYVSVDPSAPTLWSTVPTPKRENLERRQLWRSQGPSSGVAAIMGQWPGDEDEDDVARQLEKIS